MSNSWKLSHVAAIGALAGLAAICAAWAVAQPNRSGARANEPPDAEFHFARLAYAGARGMGSRWGRGAWTTDYPEAETHLLEGLSRLTRIDTGATGRIVDLSNDEVMKYPWLYAVEVGRWYLSDMEAARLREYLLRGGFLIVDDFWGTLQWNVFTESMHRVFPDRPIVELDESHELLHVLYDLDQRIQIPGVSYIRSGVTWQQDGRTPHWRGIFDDEGRLMVAVNFNMDLGDAWEHADTPAYPEPMTALAYRFAVNYTIYAMTH